MPDADPDQVMHGQLETTSGCTLMCADVPAGMELSATGTIGVPLAKAPWHDEFGGRDTATSHAGAGFTEAAAGHDQVPTTRRHVMLLFVALVLFILFGGLGFVAHVLWWGIVLAVVVAVYHAVTGGKTRA